MWPFRRRQRRPALDLTPLERLAELVERVVLLLEERRGDREAPLPTAPEPAQPFAAPEPVPEPQPAPEPPPSGPPPRPAAAQAHIFFVGGPHGYRVVERDGPPPVHGDTVEVDGLPYRVLRLGPSPLPGDTRPCAFVEPEQPPRPAAPDA
jgi:hypothetical protein